ncbi:MAG: hypothetical protein ACT4OI_10650, partial [Methanobacteriota archaeon]
RLQKSLRTNSRDMISWSLHDRAAAEAIEALLPYLVVKRAEAYLLLDLRRLKGQGKKGLTVWRHANRWRDSVAMRKRCYTPEQLEEFDRTHRAVRTLRAGGYPNLRPSTGAMEAASRLSGLADPE